MRPTLVIGNKNYSSWSMRPWLALRWAGVDFEERLIPLGPPGYGEGRMPAVLAVSPTGRVPVLLVGGRAIPESTAISEWAAEQLGANLWPKDALDRAEARALMAEMHAGYAPVRRDLSMNLRRRTVVSSWPDDTRRSLDAFFERLGPFYARSAWLFGERSAADAFYAPMLTRLRTYGVAMPDAFARALATLEGDADFAAWNADAVAEPWRIEVTERLWPGPSPTPK